MKKLLIINTVVTFLVASSGVNAYTIIKEYSISTPGAKSGYTHLSDTNTLAPRAVGVRAVAPDQSGLVKGYSKVYGKHATTIVNGTTAQQPYKYIFGVHCDGEEFYHIRELLLKPSETYRSTDESFVTVQSFSAGALPILAETRVTGESADYTTGTGTLTIRK